MSFLRNYLPNFVHFKRNIKSIISAICSLWPKSGTAKCITSRPTFKSGTARAVPLRYVPTPLNLTFYKRTSQLFLINCNFHLRYVIYYTNRLLCIADCRSLTSCRIADLCLSEQVNKIPYNVLSLMQTSLANNRRKVIR